MTNRQRTNGAPATPTAKPDLRNRARRFFLKPAPEGASLLPARKASLEELEHTYRFADDKERLIGLIVAPVAAAIAVLVISALIAHDPAALLKSGHPNPKHVSESLYEELLGVLAALSVAMVAFAWFRKRLFLGMVTALYGLAVFNLHYWGFGVPFAMVGAWYLVRAYRAQRAFKEAGGTVGGSPQASARERQAPIHSARFTRPSSPRRRTSAVGR